jgi:hypothetical protein
LEPKFTTGDIGTDRETLSMGRNIGNPGFPKAIYKQRETYQGGKLATLEYCTTSNVRRDFWGADFGNAGLPHLIYRQRTIIWDGKLVTKEYCR